MHVYTPAHDSPLLRTGSIAFLRAQPVANNSRQTETQKLFFYAPHRGPISILNARRRRCCIGRGRVELVSRAEIRT